MSIANALGMTNEQFMKMIEENKNESNPKRQHIRNEQKTVPRCSEYCKEICKDGDLCS